MHFAGTNVVPFLLYKDLKNFLLFSKETNSMQKDILVLSCVAWFIYTCEPCFLSGPHAAHLLYVPTQSTLLESSVSKRE